MKSILFGITISLLIPSGILLAQDQPAADTSAPYWLGNLAQKQTDNAIHWVKEIAVTDPAYGSEINGKTTINFTAPTLDTFRVMCWQQPTKDNPDPAGHDQVVADNLKTDAAGTASFDFPGDNFPNGPITIRIAGKNKDGTKQDICELQVFNKGGVKWNQGIPKNDPPGAAGMKLIFSDDFDGPLSITHDGVGAKYQGHKTGGGDFSGWPFTSMEQALNPFSQEGTWLRIHASKTDAGSSSGLISSAHEDGTGLFASAPCYFECRFIAQSGYGTWPAFWLLSQGGLSKDDAVKKLGSDEYDAIEAYGGHGPGAANFANYAATSHYWGEKDENGKDVDGSHDHSDIPMMELGSKSSWSTTFHTYGIQITKDKITYYFDDIPAFSHPNKGLARTQALWFLVNYAIGGISGWKIDLDRYNNSSDMWVDYIRVYQGQ